MRVCVADGWFSSLTCPSLIGLWGRGRLTGCTLSNQCDLLCGRGGESSFVRFIHCNFYNELDPKITTLCFNEPRKLHCQV